MTSLTTVLPADPPVRACRCGAPLVGVAIPDAAVRVLYPTQCGRCQAAADAAAAAATARPKAARVLRVPARYAEASLANFPPRLSPAAGREPAHDPATTNSRDTVASRYARLHQLAVRYCGNWEAHRAPATRFPAVVLLLGSPGSGKTWLAYAMARAIAETTGDVAVALTLSAAVKGIRETWRKDHPTTERAALARLTRPPLLVLDDVSRHAFTGDPWGHLFDILAERESELRPTIITSNEPMPVLAEFLGAPILSRAAGNVWTFPSVDLRMEATP
jgi:hypothetical protein